MPQRSPRLRYEVVLTPQSEDVDLERVQDHLASGGSFDHVWIEDDGTIEVAVHAPTAAAAKARVEAKLGDTLAPSFIIGSRSP